jgi:hypothetical protein
MPDVGLKETEPVAPAQPCGAMLPRLRPIEWACDGSDVITVMRGPGDRPVVIPLAALDAVMAHRWAGMYVAEEFTGGDHLHMDLTWRELNA